MTNAGVIISIILIVIILGIFLLYKSGILRRHVTVTIIENLPPWIFKKGRREDYSKNCELKSSKNTDNELESENKDNMESCDSYGEAEASKEKQTENYPSDSRKTETEDSNEDSERKKTEMEGYEKEHDDNFTQKTEKSDSGVLETKNSHELSEEIAVESIEVSDEQSAIEEKDSEQQEHKPKFITNSLSMLKDYEKLLDKLNDNSLSESITDIMKKEEDVVQEENSESKEIGEIEDPQGICKVKCDEEKQESKEDQQEHEEEKQDSKKEKVEIVYWTTSGKTYHKKKTCTALARSKVIHSGTIAESGKLSACSKCK